MTDIHTTTIVLCAMLIVMGIAFPFLNIFFRKIKTLHPSTAQPHDPTSASLSPVSLVLYAHDNARDLERHLPAILSQDYTPGFEVIVVEGKSEDDTDDVLKRLKLKYQNLYTTFVPESARYMSRNKLAITLGVKAAKNEWILLTEPTCHPDSDKWISTMAQHCNDSTQIVIGDTFISDEATDYQRFRRRQIIRYIFRGVQKGKPYRCEPGNLMFRKDMFIHGRTFEGNLEFIRGEYDFLVNKFATRSNTAIVAVPEASVTEDALSRKQWINRQLYYMETRKHLRNSFSHRLPVIIDQAALHFSIIIPLLIFGISVWKITSHLSPEIYYPLAIASLLSLLSAIILRTWIDQKALHMHDTYIPSYKIIPFELSVLPRFIFYKFKYHRADKYDFISHKL